MKYNIFFILLTILFSCDTETQKEKIDTDKQREKIVQDIISKGQSGDIILKNGYGMVSKTIVKILNERTPISHCGILIKDSIKQEFYIIHSVAKQVSDADGVQKISLDKFINDVKPDDFYLLRYNTNDNIKIVNEAQCFLNARIPFDHKYNLYNDNELYCSELIYKIFFNQFQEEVFIPLKYGTSKLLYFNTILEHQNFEKIIN